jgi:peroxiredoxin
VTCQALVQGFEELYQERGPDGFVVLDVIVEDAYGAPPTAADASTWKDGLSLTYPVLVDDDAQFYESYGGDQEVFVYYVIDRNGIIAWHEDREDEGSLDRIREQVDQLMNE